MRHITRDVRERFYAKIMKIPNGCWKWIGAHTTSRGNYPQMLLNARRPSYLAHRLSHEMHIGPIPRGHHVHHRCFDTMCVNPDHLEALTPKEHNRRTRERKTSARSH
jgi:hypothetical protein